jgi:predicted RNase H-like HicB family nuclease
VHNHHSTGSPSNASLSVTNKPAVEATAMEQITTLHIEKLPEGVYLATCDEIPGLLAQGRTVTETLEIARDVAKKLLEAQSERQPSLANIEDSFDYPLILSC